MIVILRVPPLCPAFTLLFLCRSKFLIYKKKSKTADRLTNLSFKMNKRMNETVKMHTTSRKLCRILIVSSRNLYADVTLVQSAVCFEVWLTNGPLIFQFAPIQQLWRLRWFINRINLIVFVFISLYVEFNIFMTINQ